MKRSVFAVMAFAFFTLISPFAHAQVLGTTAEGDGGFGVGYSFDANTNLIIGQAFTLIASTSLASISVYVNGNGTVAPQDQFAITLTNLIGSTATPANVLFSGVGTFPNSLLGEHDPVNFLTPLTLPAGTYYLVLTSGGGTGDGWGTGGTILPSTLGTVGSSYVGITSGSVGNYTNLDPLDPNESHANFLVTAVPEPAGLAVLSAMALPLLKRRRKPAAILRPGVCPKVSADVID